MVVPQRFTVENRPAVDRFFGNLAGRLWLLVAPFLECGVNSLNVIDYSRIAFRSFLPPHRKGKFIQVTDGDTEHEAMAPYELATHHAVILERFAYSTQ